MLSRTYLVDNKPNDLFDENIEVCVIQATEQRVSELQNATKSEPILMKLAGTLIEGWPEMLAATPPELKPYYTHKDDISQEDGLLFKGTRIIIPSSMLSDMLKRIHESHQGIVRSKQLAREQIYWPGMNNEI